MDMMSTNPSRKQRMVIRQVFFAIKWLYYSFTVFIAMFDVADYTNEVKRDSETLLIIRQIEVRSAFVNNYHKSYHMS